jgi:hypothetical protein
MRGIVGVAVIAIASSGLAQAQTKCDLQSKPDTLSRCIEQLQKEIERSRLEIQELKTANGLINKQLCMIAIEQHRSNSHSEALKLIIENACARFKKPSASEKRS